MTDAAPALRRTVTLNAASGTPVVTVPVLPAVVAVVAALAIAPRLTALAALAALLRRMSLTLHGRPSPASPAR